MSAKKAFTITWTGLLLTVPWWFFKDGDAFFGLPPWAAYAVIGAVLYSFLLAFVLQKYWRTDSHEK